MTTQRRAKRAKPVGFFAATTAAAAVGAAVFAGPAAIPAAPHSAPAAQGTALASVVPVVWAAPALPVIPNHTFPVSDFGAVGDGKTKNTAALQKALDTCAQAGGGIVSVPEGRFLTGPLRFGSNTELRLAKNAVLLLSDNPADFVLTNNRYEDGFTAHKCHDLAITGEGTIDGQGASWWAAFRKNQKGPHRPYLMTLSDCQRVLVKGVTLTNSPMFHLVPQRSRDVTIDGIQILAPATAPNTDGIDPSGWDFHITGCIIDTGDDNIAVKPTTPLEAGKPSCRNFLIEKCVFRHGHGMSVGGQTPGGLENMTVRDCTFDGTDAGIRLKAPRGNGGLVQNLVYERLAMKGVKVPVYLTSFYPHLPDDPGADPAQPVSATTPIWRHIVIRDVAVSGSPEAGRILGLAEMPIDDVAFTNVTIAAGKPMKVFHARNIRFVNSVITLPKGAALVSADADVSGLDSRSVAPEKKKAPK